MVLVVGKEIIYKSHVMSLVHGNLLAKYELTAQLHEALWFVMNFGLPNSCLDFFKLSCRPEAIP